MNVHQEYAVFIFIVSFCATGDFMLVFDTSTIIDDPHAINTGYPGEDIVLPLIVIMELDKLKTFDGNQGFSAREALRILDDMRKNGMSDGMVGSMKRDVGGFLFVDAEERSYPVSDEESSFYSRWMNSHDSDVVHCALKQKKSGHDVTLVTQDRAMSLIADILGVPAMGHGVEEIELTDGFVYIDSTEQEINDIFRDGEVLYMGDDEIPVNHGVVLSHGSQSALGIMDSLGYIQLVNRDMMSNALYGCSPKGVEQCFAASLLAGNHNGSFPREFLGALSGRSGSGKTTIALAAAIQGVSLGHYEKIIVFRPMESVGKDMGFLPGGVDEKMEPWTAAINDALQGIGVNKSDFIIDKLDEDTGEHVMLELDKDSVLSVESVNFVRGRTFTNTFVIVDEAQNLGTTELKTLASRCGRGSAFVCTFDPSQIDNAYLKSKKNEGVVSFLDDILPHDMAWHIRLSTPIRGGVSALID